MAKKSVTKKQTKDDSSSSKQGGSGKKSAFGRGKLGGIGGTTQRKNGKSKTEKKS